MPKSKLVSKRELDFLTALTRAKVSFLIVGLSAAALQCKSRKPTEGSKPRHRSLQTSIPQPFISACNQKAFMNQARE